MTKPVLAWTFPGGRLVQEVTEVVLVNNVEKLIGLSGANGKRKVINNVRMVNGDNVARDCVITLFTTAGKTEVIKIVGSATRNAGAALNWPNSVTGETATNPLGQNLLMLEFGDELEFKWTAGGVSAGATDADGLVVEYFEMDVESS